MLAAVTRRGGALLSGGGRGVWRHFEAADLSTKTLCGGCKYSTSVHDYSGFIVFFARASQFVNQYVCEFRARIPQGLKGCALWRNTFILCWNFPDHGVLWTLLDSIIQRNIQ